MKLQTLPPVSYTHLPSGSDDVEFVWDTDSKGTICLTDYQIRQYYVTRERQSYSAAFDWDINANHKLFFKGIFNNRNDWENRYRLTLKDLNKDVNKKKEGAVADNKASVRLQTKAGSPNNRNARLERQRTMDFTLGGEHLFGKLSMDWNASYARASEERPNERYLGYELKKQNFDIDLSEMCIRDRVRFVPLHSDSSDFQTVLHYKDAGVDVACRQSFPYVPNPHK